MRLRIEGWLLIANPCQRNQTHRASCERGHRRQATVPTIPREAARPSALPDVHAPQKVKRSKQRAGSDAPTDLLTVHHLADV